MESRARGAVYLDASAIVKLVVREHETDALLRYLSDADLVASEVVAVEVPRAAYLKTGVAETIGASERLLRHFHLVALDEDLHRAAAQAEPAHLRSLDAVHLACALRVRDQIDAVVVDDRRLGAAVRDAGLHDHAPGAAHE